MRRADRDAWAPDRRCGKRILGASRAESILLSSARSFGHGVKATTKAIGGEMFCFEERLVRRVAGRSPIDLRVPGCRASVDPEPLVENYKHARSPRKVVSGASGVSTKPGAS